MTLRMVTVPRDLYYHEVAYVRRLEALARAIIDNNPADECGDGICCLDAWRKEAKSLLEK